MHGAADRVDDLCVYICMRLSNGLEPEQVDCTTIPAIPAAIPSMPVSTAPQQTSTVTRATAPQETSTLPTMPISIAPQQTSPLSDRGGGAVARVTGALSLSTAPQTAMTLSSAPPVQDKPASPLI